MKTLFSLLLSFVIVCSAIAQSQPESAEKILKETLQQAKKEHKKAIIIFSCLMVWLV